MLLDECEIGQPVETVNGKRLLTLKLCRQNVISSRLCSGEVEVDYILHAQFNLCILVKVEKR